MAQNRPKFLRDKTGRVFLNTAKLRDSGRGFYEIPDPVDFPEAGTAQGVFLNEDGRITTPNHPKARPAQNRPVPNPPTPEMTPSPSPSPGAEAYPPAQAEDATPDPESLGGGGGEGSGESAPDGWG